MTGFAGANCAETERLVAEALALGIEPVALDARGRAVPITGVATTFTQAFGNADLEFSEVSFVGFLQADRRFGRAASLRLGLRYDATNHSRDVLRLKRYSYRTEQAYTQWIRRFILFHNKRHPTEMGAAEVRAFLVHLAVEGPETPPMRLVHNWTAELPK